MKINMEIVGVSPLLMHNEQLSDPDNSYTRQIKELTSKRTNATEKDKEHISKLEWFGGLYLDDKREIVVPTANFLRCLREAASITKKGRHVARAVLPSQLSMPLLLDGPRIAESIWPNPVYIDQRQVKVGQGRIKRTRPIFPKWALNASFELLEDVLDFQDLVNITEMAGRATGLGDARILGYGRFITKLKRDVARKEARAA